MLGLVFSQVALFRSARRPIGAQCGNSARWDLCGGRPGLLARGVPTATPRYPYPGTHRWRGTRYWLLG